MPRYVLLLNWTDAGVPTFAELEQRAEDAAVDSREQAIRTAVAALPRGGRLLELVWTLGQYDMVAFLEAASNEEVGGLALYLAESHSVRTVTLPAFDAPSTGRVLDAFQRLCTMLRAGGPGHAGGGAGGATGAAGGAVG